MPIFGDWFDFDGDGRLNCVEQAADLLTFERLQEMMEQKGHTEDDWFNPVLDDEIDEEDDWL
ncbi:MAG: hypothetical protein ACOYI3_02260 [Christensenellales bacterium]|jgi:hypothetical protein